MCHACDSVWSKNSAVVDRVRNTAFEGRSDLKCQPVGMESMVENGCRSWDFRLFCQSAHGDVDSFVMANGVERSWSRETAFRQLDGGSTEAVH